MSGQYAAKTVFELLEVYVQWPHDKVAISFWGSPLDFSLLKSFVQLVTN